MNNKIPPPVYLIVALALMWVAKGNPFDVRFALPFASAIASVLFFAGAATAGIAVWQFRKARTTIDPLNPAKASSLVADGMFRYSRNPMYLGMAIILLGGVIKFGSVSAFAVLVLFVLVITQLQIKPEEKALLAIFGEDFSTYCEHVRRWI